MPFEGSAPTMRSDRLARGFALGGNVLGGRVHGRWPGLEADQLFGPGDLVVTTDYRDVLSEVCRFRLNNPAISEIFPNYQPQRSGFVRMG